MSGLDAVDDVVEAVASMAKAVFGRRGEAATMDMTRVAPEKAQTARDEKAREGKR